MAKLKIKEVKAAASMDFSAPATDFDGPGVDFDAGSTSFDAGEVSFDTTVQVDDIVDDPLGAVKYTGSVEVDAPAEASELLKAFKERAAKEQARLMAATDSEFWFAVCFQTREQKEEFLRVLGLIAHGDKYLNGEVLAKKLGITLSPVDVSYRDARVDPKFAALSHPIKGAAIGGE